MLKQASYLYLGRVVDTQIISKEGDILVIETGEIRFENDENDRTYTHTLVLSPNTTTGTPESWFVRNQVFRITALKEDEPSIIPASEKKQQRNKLRKEKPARGKKGVSTKKTNVNATSEESTEVHTEVPAEAPAPKKASPKVTSTSGRSRRGADKEAAKASTTEEKTEVAAAEKSSEAAPEKSGSWASIAAKSAPAKSSGETVETPEVVATSTEVHATAAPVKETTHKVFAKYDPEKRLDAAAVEKALKTFGSVSDVQVIADKGYVFATFPTSEEREALIAKGPINFEDVELAFTISKKVHKKKPGYSNRSRK